MEYPESGMGDYRESAICVRSMSGYRASELIYEGYEIKKFTDMSEGMRQDFTKAETRLALNMPMMQLCIYSTMTAIFWFGSRFILSGGMTTGNLMSLVTYTMQMLNSMMMLSMVFTMIIMSPCFPWSVSRNCSVKPPTSRAPRTASAKSRTAASSSGMYPSAIRRGYQSQPDGCEPLHPQRRDHRYHRFHRFCQEYPGTADPAAL